MKSFVDGVFCIEDSKFWRCFHGNKIFLVEDLLFLNVYPWYAFSSNQTGHSLYDKMGTHNFFLWYEQPYVFWACNCREIFWNIFHIECAGVLLSFALKGPEIGTNFWDCFMEKRSYFHRTNLEVTIQYAILSEKYSWKLTKNTNHQQIRNWLKGEKKNSQPSAQISSMNFCVCIVRIDIFYLCNNL